MFDPFSTGTANCVRIGLKPSPAIEDEVSNTPQGFFFLQWSIMKNRNKDVQKSDMSTHKS